MAEPLPPGGTIEPTIDPARSTELTAACLIASLDGARRAAAPTRHWLFDVDEVRLRRAADGPRRLHDRSTARTLTLALPDALVSARHALVRRTGARWTLVDEGSRNGTTVNGQRTREHHLVDGDVIQIGRVGLVFRVAALARPPAALDEDADDLYPRGLPAGLWTMSPALERELADAASVARSPAAVTILGETGTGKELASRAIHALSGRAGAFVPVNCGALPIELIASELFGHRRGAFSGAVADQEGLVAAAAGGTLFLDEVGELPLPVQAALLRVLQDGEVRPVGASRAVKVDVRVIAATHVDLPARVRAGQFREDLWSRLAGYVLRLPALRERKEDLGLLMRGILGRIARGASTPTLSADAVAAIVGHDWPRNVRQLEQAMEQAVRRSAGGEITAQHLPAEVRARPAKGRDELIDLLRRHRGNTTRAAAEEGVSRQAIEKRCRALDIDYKAFRNPAEPTVDEEG